MANKKITELTAFVSPALTDVMPIVDLSGPTTKKSTVAQIAAVMTFLKAQVTDFSHSLLSASHGDTLAAVVARGSIIFGNATPKWDALAKGAADTFLRSDGTDLAWATGNPTVQTTAATGTQNNFDLNGHRTFLTCSGAAPVFTGFTVLGAAPSNGDTVTVHVLTAGNTAKCNYRDAASTVGNRVDTHSANGQIIGYNGSMTYVYDATSTYWRQMATVPGQPISIAYASCTFTGSGTLTWTVASGDFEYLYYQQVGTTVTFSLRLSTTTVAGAGNTMILAVSGGIPGGFTLTRSIAGLFCRTIDNGTFDVGYVGVSSGFRFSKRDTSNWAASTDNTQVDANFTIAGMD